MNRQRHRRGGLLRRGLLAAATLTAFGAGDSPGQQRDPQILVNVHFRGIRLPAADAPLVVMTMKRGWDAGGRVLWREGDAPPLCARAPRGSHPRALVHRGDYRIDAFFREDYRIATIAVQRGNVSDHWWQLPAATGGVEVTFSEVGEPYVLDIGVEPGAADRSVVEQLCGPTRRLLVEVTDAEAGKPLHSVPVRIRRIQDGSLVGEGHTSPDGWTNPMVLPASTDVTGLGDLRIEAGFANADRDRRQGYFAYAWKWSDIPPELLQPSNEPRRYTMALKRDGPALDDVIRVTRREDGPCPRAAPRGDWHLSVHKRTTGLTPGREFFYDQYYLRDGTQVYPGQTIETPENMGGSVTLRLPLALVDLEPGTVFALPCSPGSAYELSDGVALIEGREVEVQTRMAVAGVKGTKFQVRASADATEVMVFQGVVEVTPTNRALPSFSLQAGQQATVTPRSVSPVTNVGPPTPVAPGSGQEPALGSRWAVRSTGGWTASFERRNNTNIFDAVWTRGRERVTESVAVTLSGTQVTARAVQSSNNSRCTYTGELAGSSISGRYACVKYPGRSWSWQATIDSHVAAAPPPTGLAGFTRHPGQFVDDRNRMDSYPPTVEQCAAECLGQPWCRSFDFNTGSRSAGKKCSLSDAAPGQPGVRVRNSSGWDLYVRTEGSAGGASSTVALGSRWAVRSTGGWTATFERRDNTNIFDAVWRAPGGRTNTESVEVTLSGTQVTVVSSSGSRCTYTGTLTGTRISGSYTCARTGSSGSWQATIESDDGGRTEPPTPTGLAGFTRHPGQFVDDRNRMDSYPPTVEQCAAECLGQPWCRSFDFNTGSRSAGKKCSLSDAAPGQPGVRVRNSSGWDLYVRIGSHRPGGGAPPTDPPAADPPSPDPSGSMILGIGAPELTPAPLPLPGMPAIGTTVRAGTSVGSAAAVRVPHVELASLTSTPGARAPARGRASSPEIRRLQASYGEPPGGDPCRVGHPEFEVEIEGEAPLYDGRNYHVDLYMGGLLHTDLEAAEIRPGYAFARLWPKGSNILKSSRSSHVGAMPNVLPATVRAELWALTSAAQATWTLVDSKETTLTNPGFPDLSLDAMSGIRQNEWGEIVEVGAKLKGDPGLPRPPGRSPPTFTITIPRRTDPAQTDGRRTPWSFSGTFAESDEVVRKVRPLRAAVLDLGRAFVSLSRHCGWDADGRNNQYFPFRPGRGIIRDPPPRGDHPPGIPEGFFGMDMPTRSDPP